MDNVNNVPRNSGDYENVIQEQKNSTGTGSLQGRKTSKDTSSMLYQVLKVFVIALVIITLAAGTTGLLIHIGKLGVTITPIGPISPQIAFLMMVGGYAIALILTTAVTLACCMNRANEKGSNSPRISSDNDESGDENESSIINNQNNNNQNNNNQNNLQIPPQIPIINNNENNNDNNENNNDNNENNNDNNEGVPVVQLN